MCFYPLHGKEWAAEKDKLAIIHRDKQAAFEKKVLFAKSAEDKSNSDSTRF